MPDEFTDVSVEELTRLRGRGMDAVEDTYGETFVNQATTIFFVESGEMNSLEVNYQPFDPAIDGDYDSTWKAIDDMLVEILKTRLPNDTVHHATRTEEIDGLTFHVSESTMKLPDDRVLTMLLFSRLFDRYEFSVNVIFADKKKGELLLRALRASDFS